MTVRPAHLPHVTVSMRVMSAGEGYRYLLRTVAVGDGRRDFATPLTRYYEEKGTPPGFWLGSALPGFGAGELVPRAEVTERQLRRLLGGGLDPITGQALGSAYRTYRTAAERALARIAELPDRLTAAEREQETARIQAEEARRHHAAVAGFDFTFSAPKSVSTLWALLDAGTQALIVDAHHAAIDDILAVLEGEVAMTRIGANGVAQVEVRGVAATAYDHYDSRSGDPQLHTHVVVANRVQAVRDGRWRTLDSRALHAAVVALSEHYNATLADRLAVILGLGWEDRTRPRDRTPAWEIVGVPDELIREFSSRSRDIDEEVARLIDEYERDHQRSPTRVQVIRLRQRATLSTRPEKTADSLADLTRKWRDRASTLLKRDATGWAVDILRTRHAQPLLRADDVPLDEVARIAIAVVAAVGERRSTWRRWNLHAEAARRTMGLRFASPEDRAAVIGLVVDEAETRSVELSPPELASTPPEFRREDGSSAFRPRASTLYSSDDILTAEDHLLALAGTDTAPRVMVEGLDKILRRPNRNGVILGPDQADAIERLVSSGRVLDVLVGPAGSGKTTTLGALRAVWERRYGRRSVVGLAPSAAAAEVLAGDLGVPTENTAKWLWEHRQGNWNLHRNQLLIIDEASLAGTVALDQLAGHAATVGAKVVLVGDWAQLAAVDASGAFGMLVRARGDAPELVDIRRFRAEWEKEASLSIRVGDADALLSYIDNDRILDGPQSGMLDAAYNAWQDDLSHGKDTILIAHTVELVVQLNERARLDRMAAGQVGASGNRLHDGTEAGVGDRIITPPKRSGTSGWVAGGVKNGRPVGCDTAPRRRLAHRPARRPPPRGDASPSRPPTSRRDVELGYAITVHRAQGATVDTAHAIVGGSGMTREVLYVAMTRGRDSNRVYVATDQTELEQHQLPLEDPDGLTILSRILERIGAELSAREAIVSEQDEVRGRSGVSPPSTRRSPRPPRSSGGRS